MNIYWYKDKESDTQEGMNKVSTLFFDDNGKLKSFLWVCNQGRKDWSESEYGEFCGIECFGHNCIVTTKERSFENVESVIPSAFDLYKLTVAKLIDGKRITVDYFIDKDSLVKIEEIR